MNKNQESLPHKALWITGLVIQGFAIALLSLHLISLDPPKNILSLVFWFGVYAAIVIPTVSIVRDKTKSVEFIVALGLLNIVATIIAVGFLVFVAGLYDALHYDY